MTRKAVNPTVSGISPAQGLVGTAVNVTITGTGFGPGATIQAGTSITVSNVSVSSSTTITATFTIQNSADAGGNWNVTVTSGGQTSTSKTFFVQIPTSLNVISVNLIANGANGGCKSTDYGIHVDVKYQVQDQNTHAIQSAAMIPQESVNGSGWGDILTTFYTNGNGTYDDAPLGTCATKSFNMNVTQAVRMDVNGGYYNVRTNNFNVIGSSVGHGSISNGSDIKKTR
ncbi:MAG TPA: IPT/TIG domain-containing protein [Candidatus Sulfotelmatobacter sp.]|nr:IPT/TIG domain-containing protein [Candidatus Sulfotelmatobacter sp.]